MVTTTFKAVFHRAVDIEDNDAMSLIATECGFTGISLNASGRIMLAEPQETPEGEEPVTITDFMMMLANIISDVENIALFEEVVQYEPQFEELPMAEITLSGLYDAKGE